MTEHDDPVCLEMQVRLAEEADGTLAPPARQELRAHLAVCPSCDGLASAARRGRSWLAGLDDIELPPSLVQDILAATTLAREASIASAAPPAPRTAGPRAIVREWAEVFVAFVRQPRLVMTAAMAFFSVSVIANATGATVDDLGGLTPSRISRRLSLEYHEKAAGVSRYYENNYYLRELRDGFQALHDIVYEPAEGPREESTIHG